MPGILADVNAEKHLRQLVGLLDREWRQELWQALHYATLTFSDIGIDPATSDRLVWQRCQAEELILLTANRNRDGVDSLEEAIRTLNHKSSLPIFTIADDQRFVVDSVYREQAADRCLEYLYELEKLRGTGRLYLP